MLKIESFTSIIETEPLVSIDLIIKEESGYFSGMRNNQPAKGKWFVTGGRIIKNETIGHAITRISIKEIVVEVNIKDILTKKKLEIMMFMNIQKVIFFRLGIGK